MLYADRLRVVVDEEIATMANKIGGLLASEMPVDETRLHELVLIINDQIVRSDLGALLDTLKVGEARFYNVCDEYAAFYHECLLDAKQVKATKSQAKVSKSRLSLSLSPLNYVLLLNRFVDYFEAERRCRVRQRGHVRRAAHAGRNSRANPYCERLVYYFNNNNNNNKNSMSFCDLIELLRSRDVIEKPNKRVCRKVSCLFRYKQVMFTRCSQY